MVGSAAGDGRAALKASAAHHVQMKARNRRRYAASLLLLSASSAFAQTAPKEPQCGGVSGDPALAIKVCTRAIEFGSLERPDLAKAYFARGTEYANQDNHDRAIADYDLAIELDPKLALAYYNRALSWSSKGESERAIADYNAALKLRPNDPNGHIGRAVEYTVQGDYARAIADYELVIRTQPESSAGYFGRGRARFYAGDYMSAASDFYRVHQLEPGMYTALWLYLARKRADIPGEQTLAQEAGTSGFGVWPAPIVALYLGTSTPDAAMRAATHPEPARNRDLRCEASFYVAQWHLLRGAHEAAAPLLREAQKTCPHTYIEHEGSLAELRRLQKKPQS
jgi:lipoprotein NlpI